MNTEFGNGMYCIDDDFKILYFNDALKKMYPDAEIGQYCYNTLGCRNNMCPNCPLVNADRQNTFYNHIRHELIHAQAAEISLPGIGDCYSIVFSRKTDDKSDVNGTFENNSVIMEHMNISERTGMIGGYCEEGFPLFFANEKMINMLGYDDYADFCSGIQGLVANTIHPDDMAQVSADIGPSYYEGLEYNTIYRMPRKDGTWFWTYDSGRVIKAEDGRLAIVSYCTDITDIKQNQKNLEEENKILQEQNRLIEFINEGMPGGYHRCALTEGYPFLYISEKFMSMLGFTRDEIRYKFDDKFINLVHPDDRVLVSSSSDDLKDDNNKNELNLHYRIAAKNGYIQVVDSSRLFEYDGTEFFQGVIVDVSKEEHMKQDIKSLKIAQKALSEALSREQNYRQQLNDMQNEIVDSISCGVFAYTLPDYELLIVNDVAKKIIGCGENDDPIKSMYRFMTRYVSADDRERVINSRNDLKKTGDVVLLDYKACVDGKTVSVHSNSKYLEKTNGKPYILITMLDTTERDALTSNLIRERKAYRDALANGSEFSFLFDVTEGLIHEHFVTAHGIDLIEKMGLEVPVSFDEMLKRYVERCEIEFADEKMRSNFTCKGLIDAFENGITNLITEYYNPKNDMFFRVNCLLSSDDETGHIQAAIVADNVTDIRKKDKLQQEALQAAYDEMNVRIDAMLDGISGGLKIVDVDDNYRYIFISEGAARLQGYTVDEFLEKFGSRVTRNIYENDGEPALAEANRQIAEKGTYSVKYRVAHRDGTIKWVIDRGKYVEYQITGKKLYYILMQDVTELEDKNIQVSSVLSMQKQMTDFLGSGIFAYTLPERRILILNQEAKKMFDYIGCDEKQFGLDLFSKVVPEDVSAIREAITHLEKPGDHVKYIFHSDSRTEGRRTFKCHTKLLSFESGQRYVLSSLTDITEQELNEKRLDNERSQYRNALAFGSSGFFTLDLTDDYVYDPVLSKNGEDLTASLGLDLPEKYDTLAALWFSDNRIVSSSSEIEIAKSRDKLIECCKNGTSILDIEYQVINENKYYHLMILLYKSNEHINASFIIYDITSTRHDERQRRAIIDSLGHIFLALYHFSFSEQKCTIIKAHPDISDAMPEKCSFKLFYEQYTEKFVTAEYRDEVRKFLDPENIKKELMDTEYISIEFKRVYLGWCRVFIVAAERDKNGVVTSAVFAGNVIEKQKQSELAQREALKAAYESANMANSAKTDFLANMSHDIRTPMNAIIGMTAIAGTHLDDKERVSDCLSKISISSKHLLGLINEVLDMSKIESGKLELSEEEFNLADLIDNLLTMSKPSVAGKKHNLTVSIRNIEHENVIGDSQRIQQVFMNLMNNAVKYTPEGGSLELSITEKQTNKQCVGCYEFIFQDNGIGMSEEFQEHIFEPFARATEDSRIEKVQGTGLGMPIAKSIIQTMNGSIKVDSKINKGTKITVTIYLRLQNADENVNYEKFTDLPILVADDDEYSCIYTCDMLKEIGLNGEWVLTGQEAVERTVQRHNDKNDFFAVILDWKMPGMDGVQTTREIRRRVGKEVPIIIISAYDWSDIELEARAAGANAFISKPLFKSRMVHLFKELTGSEKEERLISDLDKFSQEDFSGKRALVVEDNALNAEIAGEILKMSGLEIEFAENGKEALDRMSIVGDGYYDIVFMDIQMPVMDGYESARAIRELPGSYTKSVPIIAMTANAFAEDVAAAKNAGMNEHIAKPLDFDQLIKALRKWIR